MLNGRNCKLRVRGPQRIDPRPHEEQHIGHVAAEAGRERPDGGKTVGHPQPQMGGLKRLCLLGKPRNSGWWTEPEEHAPCWK
jgi:hypothetical protein